MATIPTTTQTIQQT